MSEFHNTCMRCKARDVCKRHEMNSHGIRNKEITINDFVGNRFSFKLNCEHYVPMYEEHYVSVCSDSSTCSSYPQIDYQYWPVKVPCHRCSFSSLCSVDKAKQDALCLALSRNLDGQILFSCSAFNHKEVKVYENF